MIRLHFVVEGPTEEGFVNQVLANHLGQFDISADVRCVETSRTRTRIYRGGVIDYLRVKRDLAFWMREDGHDDSHFTTMFDLYRLPSDFPGHSAVAQIPQARMRAQMLEDEFGKDIGYPRFVPYIQLHEFEALIFADPSALETEFIEHEKAISNLVRLASRYPSPECIDDGPDTAPSKRITAAIPEGRQRPTMPSTFIERPSALTPPRNRPTAPVRSRFRGGAAPP